MGFWNYRMLRTEHNGEAQYTIVEAYYDDDDTVPHSYAEPHAISAETPFGLLGLLEKAKEATDRPPIVLTNKGEVIEWTEGEHG